MIKINRSMDSGTLVR